MWFVEVLQNMFTFLFSGNRNLKCSVPASENYPGWMKCTKVALFLKYVKEEHARDYQQQDSSKEKENEEVAGTSDDAELVIHCASNWSSRIPKNLVTKDCTKTEH